MAASIRMRPSLLSSALGRKGRQQFRRGLIIFRLTDAVFPDEDGELALVQHRAQPFGQKQHVAFHQPDRNRFADSFEDAKARSLGQCFRATLLLLLGLPMPLPQSSRKHAASACSCSDG